MTPSVAAQILWTQKVKSNRSCQAFGVWGPQNQAPGKKLLYSEGEASRSGLLPQQTLVH